MDKCIPDITILKTKFVYIQSIIKGDNITKRKFQTGIYFIWIELQVFYYELLFVVNLHKVICKVLLIN